MFVNALFPPHSFVTVCAGQGILEDMMMRDCEQCKQGFTTPKTGRPKRYCSDRCRQVACRRRRATRNVSPVPDLLLSRNRWVRHIKKRPVTVQGLPASVTDPTTWSSFPDVSSSRVGDGFGFVLGDGIGCIDLDHVIDDAGVLDPRAGALLDRLPSTWVEVSPSGHGLHVWGLIAERPGTRRVVGGVSVETYSKGRYITVTGRRWNDAPLALAPLPFWFE